jgi:branched-chain amino acid transport system ATP-binding protein
MLRCDAIDVCYGRGKAIKSLSFHVESKGIVALLGANGAGKSTTLRAISGILRPTKGIVTFEGERIDRLPTEAVVKRGISMVPEGRRLFGEMTVVENLELGTFNRTDRTGIKTDFERIYGYFPILRERKFQRAASLSGGEQQMLAIGRALMSRPKLLLLDEPSLGLAPLVVREIYRIIKDLNEQGLTILLVEQNARKALQLAKNAYVLETGSIILEGDPKSLLSNKKFYDAYLGSSGRQKTNDSRNGDQRAE